MAQSHARSDGSVLANIEAQYHLPCNFSGGSQRLNLSLASQFLDWASLSLAACQLAYT